jgi:hypothetical protein
MSDSLQAEHFELRVSADAAQGSTVRLFIGTTARAAGIGEDAVGDLKLAVSEAASAVVASGKKSSIVVEAVRTADGLVVWVGPLTADDLTGDLLVPQDIIAAVFPAARVDETRRAIRIPVVSEPADRRQDHSSDGSDR